MLLIVIQFIIYGFFVMDQQAEALLGGSKIDSKNATDQQRQIQCSTVRIGVRQLNPDAKTRSSKPYLYMFDCTGTVTEASTVSTAAHCFPKKFPPDGSVQPVIEWTSTDSSGKVIKKIVPVLSARSRVEIPYYPENMRETQQHGNDFEDLKLSEQIPQRCVTPVCQHIYSTGSYTAAGFGRKDEDKVDEKGMLTTPDEDVRYGTINIQNFDEHAFTAKINSEQKSIVCFGDSGGPLYYSASSNQLCLAGTISGSTAGESEDEPPSPQQAAQACRQPDANAVFNRAYASSDPSLKFESSVPKSKQNGSILTPPTH